MSIVEFVSVAGGICGIGGLLVAWTQLSKIAKNQEIATQTQEIAKEQLAKIAENQRMDILKVVLEIESQINERKAEFDKVNKQVMELDLSEPSKKQQNILSDYCETARENYFNALDRLCFCIDKEYIPERDWKDEYRDMIVGTIKNNERYFGAGSPYKNMLNINDKWR